MTPLDQLKLQTLATVRQHLAQLERDLRVELPRELSHDAQQVMRAALEQRRQQVHGLSLELRAVDFQAGDHRP